MVMVTSAQLVGGGNTVQLVPSSSGGAVQLVQSANGQTVQLVQSATGSGVQLIQSTAGGMQILPQNSTTSPAVQLVQPGRITLRPVTGQAFTNLQSLLK